MMHSTAESLPTPAEQFATSTKKRRRGKAQLTLDLEKAIHGVVEERYPITIRGIGYALFVQGMIPSMATKETQKVSRIATAMREEETLDWRKIVDDSRAVDRISAWSDPAEIVAAAVKGYRKNHWKDQPKLVEVWSEKGTVQGVLAPVLESYGLTFRVMKGFGSYTAIRQAAEDSLETAQDYVALYLGDYDPSGLYMSLVDLPKRLEAGYSTWELKRVAITECDTHGLPSFNVATKKKDPRYKWYASKFGEKAWELDAMNPNDLRARVESAIKAQIDMDKWNHSLRIEQAEIESMEEFHRQWRATARGGAA